LPARSSHSLSYVDSSLYLFGGELQPRVPCGSDLLSLNRKDPQAGWQLVHAKAEVPSPRVAHSCVAIGSQLWLFGGRSGASYAISDALVTGYLNECLQGGAMLLMSRCGHGGGCQV
jgi:hypothetical protein